MKPLPADSGLGNKDEGGDPRAIALAHTGMAAFLVSDSVTAVGSLGRAIEILNHSWRMRSDIAGVGRNRQDRADFAELELYLVHALARAGRREEARERLLPLGREIEILHGYRPDLFITRRLVARALQIRVEVETTLPAAEKSALLERAATIFRDADRENRLTRIEREIILPEIEKDLTALGPPGAP
jgi:hypothetical protein